VVITRRRMLGSTLIGASFAGALARRAAAAGPVLRIGVMNDMSGPYRDVSGPGSVACVNQALEDFGVSGKGFAVEVLTADHRNNPDVGATIARQWCDRENIDMILDVPTSSVALAVANICREKNRVYINSGGGTAELTGKQCSPNTIHWAYDTYMLAKSTGGATVKAGGTSWYFLTADYVFGHNLQDQTSAVVKAAGGTVLGASAYPFPGTTDFSSLMLKAQASGAKVLGLANAGDDTVNCIKQAHEFGLTQSMQVAGLLLTISGVHALGLAVAQGTLLTEPFYWDLNDKTRAFSARVQPKMPAGAKPNFEQAGCYSATMHYLKVAAAMGIDAAKQDGRATVARMKATPWEDDAYGSGRIREDGRNLNPAYLFRVKAPAESKAPWDYYTLVATTPGDQAFRPLAEGGCPFIHT
jgi:branched-chain amino acid transport system substrate-binding protein